MMTGAGALVRAQKKIRGLQINEADELLMLARDAPSETCTPQPSISIRPSLE